MVISAQTQNSCSQDTLSSRALGLAAFRPSARASKGILHTNKIGDIIYFYDMTATKGGHSLSSFIPPICNSKLVYHTLSKTYVKKSEDDD